MNDDYTEDEKQRIIAMIDEAEPENPFADLGLPDPFWRVREYVKALVRKGLFAQAEQALDDHTKKWIMVAERREKDMAEAEHAGPIDPKTWLALTINAIQEVDRQLHGGTDVEDYNP